MLYEDVGQSGGGQFERLLRNDDILAGTSIPASFSGSYRSPRLLLREVEPVTTTIPREMHGCWRFLVQRSLITFDEIDSSL
jgi:hypothetical protein